MKSDRARLLARVGRMACLGLLVWLVSASPSVGDGVTPTTEWVNIYGTGVTSQGRPLPVGTSVAVFDSGGTRCGEFQVRLEGWYGLMACYRDDPMTPGEEGPDAGEPLRFTINGVPAAATAVSRNGTAVPPSTPVTWSGLGDRWHVILDGTVHPVGGHSVPLRGLKLRDVLAVWILLLALSRAARLLVPMVPKQVGLKGPRTRRGE